MCGRAVVRVRVPWRVTVSHLFLSLCAIVIKSLTTRTSEHLEMQLLSTPTPLPMLSVRFHPLPHRAPVIKYVVVWNYFPFSEPNVTAVDSEVGTISLPTPLSL